jgi:hypothetical protein
VAGRLSIVINTGGAETEVEDVSEPTGDSRLDPEVAVADDKVRIRYWDIGIALAVLAVSAWFRHRQLGPPSLWLDDAWPALVIKTGWSDITTVSLTAPGFAAALKTWLHFTGFSATKAQSLAFVIGIAAPALLWLLCLTRRLGRPAALAAATLLVTSPAHIVYSARVKQYTLDSVLVIVLLWLTWRGLERPDDKRRWYLLALAAAVATATSSGIVPVVIGAFGAALLAIRAVDRPIRRRAIGAGAAYVVFAVAWWALVLRPRLGTALRDYWRSFYVSSSNPGGVTVGLRSVATRTAEGFSDLPVLLTIIVFVVAAVVVVRTRPVLSIVLLGPFVIAVVLAILQLAPIGTGRTDIYLYPLFAVLIAVALAEISIRHVLGIILALAVVVAGFARAQAPSSYPQENMKEAVEFLNDHVRPDDTIMVYSGGRYAFALYAPPAWKVTVFATKDQTNGFDVRIHRPHLSILNSYESVARYRKTVELVAQGAPRVWFIGSHGRLDALDIERALGDLGYRTAVRRQDHEAWFVSLWVKRPE